MDTTQNYQEWETQNDLGYGQLLNTFVRRRFWFAGVFVGVLAVCLPLSLMKKPVYESYMQVLLESNYKAKEVQNNFGNNKYLERQFADATVEIDYATQLKVLTSSEILSKVIDKLGWSDSERSKTEIVEQLRESLVVSQIINEQKASNAKEDAETKIIETIYTANSPTETKRVLEAIREVYLEYNLEQQEKRLKNGLEFINNQIPKARNDLIQAEAALTALSKEHNLISPEQEAIALKVNIRQIAQEREILKAQQGQTTGNYTSLQEQLGLSRENAIALSRLSQSPRYQNLLNRLQAIEIDLATQRKKFTENNPVIQELIERRDSQKSLLIQETERVLGEVPANFATELESLQKQGQFVGSDTKFLDVITESQAQLKGMRARDSNLAETEVKLNQKLVQFPELIAQYRNLAQEAQIKREALQKLLEAKQELEIELNRGGFDWQVIEPPQLGEQVAPSMLKYWSLSVVIALFLGGGAALIKEASDERIIDSDAIKRETTLPLLGTTPSFSLSAAERFLTRLPFLSSSSTNPAVAIAEVIQWQPFREALDLIYENFKLYPGNSPLQSLAVTSVLAGEGKSTFILGLALSVVRHQQKVLVIDADLRSPSLHKFFDLDNQFGLANFLAGEIDIPMIRQVSLLGENIDLITSGFRPSDPVKLLNSSRLQDLIEREKQNYDLILVDTSPTKGMVDAVKVASCCDTSVLMIRLNKIKTSELHQANALLNKLNILGIVANDCPETTQKYGVPTEYLLPQQN